MSVAQGGAAPIRIGLLVNSLVQPKWVAAMLDDIASLPFARIALVVQNDSLEPVARGGKRPGLSLRKVVENRNRLAYELFARLDARIYATGPDAFAPTSIAEYIGDAPVVRVRPRMTKFCDYLDDADVDAILEHQLDVGVRLGFRILKGRALDIARYGIWSYHHGDNHRYRGGPPGYWEVVENTPVTGSILQVLTDKLDDGSVLHRSFFRTDTLSVWRNRQNLYWKSVPAMAKKLRELHERGEEMLRSEATGEYQAYSNRLYVQPTNGQALTAGAKMLGRQLRRRVREIGSREQWFLAYRFDSVVASSDESSAPARALYSARYILPPKDRFWADPFPVLHEGRYYLFVEEYVYSSGKGEIALIELDRDGGWRDRGIVLARDYHLSYPFIFHWQGCHYMIPETAGNNTVELYRCVSFPDRWELAATLIEGISAVDATLAQIGDRWWMFTSLAAHAELERQDTLGIFHAPSPLGPWTAHRRNPVKTDVRSARPAGKLFRYNGAWYRPSQDCSESYGGAVTINRITHLSENDYHEVEAGKILPQWVPGLRGTHTINSVPGLTVVDGLRRRRKW